MNDFTFGAIAGGLIGAAWSKVQQLFTWVTGLLIVRVEIPLSHLSEAVEWYCWNHLKHTRSPFYRFEGVHTWVRSLDRQEMVIVERLGSHSQMYWSGWRPVVMTGTGEQKGAMSSGSQRSDAPVKLSFLRGTFKPDQFLQQVLKEFQAYLNGQMTSGRRFGVSKYSGTPKRLGMVNESSSAQPLAVQSPSTSALTYGRIVGHKLDDLGDPLAVGAPLDRVALSAQALAAVQDVKRWADSRGWYRQRQIPWRRGMLLYGPPGTGKSSLVRAMGQDLDWPICVFDLSMMSNQDLTTAWQSVCFASPCIVLIEDIDAIFDQRTNVLGQMGGGLTFDCLLNTLSGVGQVDGLLVVLTTNNRQTIDPALAGGDSDSPSRPGRIDLVVEMGPPDLEGRKQIARNILVDQHDLIDQLADECEGMSGAQFQERCIAEALTRYWATVPNKLAYRGLDPVSKSA